MTAETIVCVICAGPAHPACGAEYAPGVVACGACVRALWRGILARQSMRPRKGGPSFYDHVNQVRR